MRKYPIGLQDFRSIKEEGFLYIDKTRLIHTLIESGKYYFLSRPRRFGKSLLLSTIKEIFNGSKDLFTGLWIENQRDWSRKHPVIHLKLSQINYQNFGLAVALSKELDAIADDLGIALAELDEKGKFRELIRKASAKGRVVILIDEYDKPIIDYLDNLSIAEENRSVFKSFYSVLKDSDEYIRLLMITGVSRFTKVSIFSDLNNLRDITLSPAYSTLVGITQAELESNFPEEIAEMQEQNANILQTLKTWYNGYSWNGVDRVYNPFSLLNFMSDRVFHNFWYRTGTPTFLVKMMQQRREFKFEDLYLSENSLGNFDIENPLSVPLLFQTGYLTIKEYDAADNIYTLDYPNKEVQQSLVDALLSAYRDVFPGDSMAVSNGLQKALKANDIEKLIAGLNAIISTIPYDHWKADSESIFHIIIHLTFKKIGLDVQSEVHSSRGRCDVLVQTATHIYAIELKLDATAEQALNQIFEKGYLNPFQSDSRIKTAIGINFSSIKREIENYIVKEI